jgi:hypothetical protein
LLWGDVVVTRIIRDECTKNEGAGAETKNNRRSFDSLRFALVAQGDGPFIDQTQRNTAQF